MAVDRNQASIQVAKPAYLGRFLFSGLVSVAGHCARSGVRVVSASTFSARYCLHQCLGTVYLALVLQVVQRVAVKLVRYWVARRLQSPYAGPARILKLSFYLCSGHGPGPRVNN
jgi:hypothetical protein